MPINSSKILLGNEFTLNYKSTYNNEMKNLINSMELISFTYTNSNNNTLNKFGIEYSYIALAMNNILKLTNNNIENMEINKTIGITIDYNWCLVWITGFIVSLVGFAFALLGTFGMALIALASLIYATLSEVQSCFHDFYL
ncbi:hypothetical protein [Acidiplasma sp.]|uniref:hypothetical protein n=1 Tax=Acidiplasma sp. TaxID=1872114 RepID=UPI00259070E2|nr:hypothetical protein [Acidiplasma sp.]